MKGQKNILSPHPSCRISFEDFSLQVSHIDARLPIHSLNTEFPPSELQSVHTQGTRVFLRSSDVSSVENSVQTDCRCDSDPFTKVSGCKAQMETQLSYPEGR